MPIVSGQFALLVLLGLFVYYALPLSWRSRWLLLLSLVFYASWSL